MSFTPSYDHNTTMSKLNVNGSIYWLKDADLRAIIATFGDAVLKDVDVTFVEDSTNLVTSAAIQAWVEDQISDLEGVMHFRGVITRQEGETDAQAIARVVAEPEAGDVVIMQDNGKEYIYGGSSWEEIGDQNIYLTIATAAATYVPKTTTVAGIALDHNITVSELEAASALNLKALAHKDSATGSVTTADSIDDITVAKAGEYAISGDTVAVPQTWNAMDVTPAGTVAITAGTAAAATYQKTSSATIAASAPGDGQTANYTPAGSVTLPTITAAVTLGKEAVATVTDAGTAYTISDGGVTKAADTTAKFVKKGVSFAMDTTDTEQLNLNYVATTDTEFYTDAVTAAGDITYTKQTLSGALPTFGSKDVATSVSSATAVYDGDATFNGTGAVIGATLAYETANATVTQPTFTGTFSGTAASVTPTAATTTDALASGNITVPTETISLTLNKTSKTVTVS